MLFYKRIGGRIPNRISASFKSCSSASRRKGRSIRLAFNQFFAAERHNNGAVFLRSDKTVVFFCGNARKRLKPVRKMRRALFDSPFFHSVGNLICNIYVQRLAVIKRFFKSLKSFFRQPLFHGLLIKNHTSEKFRYVYRHFTLLSKGTKPVPFLHNRFFIVHQVHSLFKRFDFAGLPIARFFVYITISFFFQNRI